MIVTHSNHVTRGTKFSYKDDNDYSLQLTRWFLIPIGAWPQISTATKVKRLFSHIHILTCASLIAIIMVPYLLYVLLEEKDSKIKLNTTVLVAYGDGLARAVRSENRGLSGNDTTGQDQSLHLRILRGVYAKRHIPLRYFEDRQVMIRQVKISRFISGFCAVFMQSGTFLFAIAKSLSTTIVIVGNETVSMPCPTYTKFIDTRFCPVNEIIVGVEWLYKQVDV
ncbi:PREDICTED: uncharacterized protein LOC108761971 [Trachymyrmex cornetzi]|uniref:uncharacterized protein LOC108761971 n=1 Tax=Trachymyrmex cornetzi TaxID=471704 RepID=UPI00084F3DE5|nr:PREDICTED: uncharacterized protein LOC108761971 [Trachymyrmex cornetzi]